MLIPKDRVRWIDPDDGACTQEGVIVSIENGIALVATDGGGEVEALLHELVPLVRSDGTPFVAVTILVWVSDGEPDLFAGRTPEEADTALWLELEDHYRDMVGRTPGPDTRRNIQRYFRAASAASTAEYLYAYTRYI